MCWLGELFCRRPARSAGARGSAYLAGPCGEATTNCNVFAVFSPCVSPRFRRAAFSPRRVFAAPRFCRAAVVPRRVFCRSAFLPRCVFAAPRFCRAAFSPRRVFAAPRFRRTAFSPRRVFAAPPEQKCEAWRTTSVKLETQKCEAREKSVKAGAEKCEA